MVRLQFKIARFWFRKPFLGLDLAVLVTLTMIRAIKARLMRCAMDRVMSITGHFSVDPRDVETELALHSAVKYFGFKQSVQDSFYPMLTLG
jgi:hypothetical protein